MAGDGYEKVFDEIQKKDPSLATLSKVVVALNWRCLAYAVYKEHSEDLRYFVDENLAELRELGRLDKQIIDNASAEVRQKVLASARPPIGIGRGKVRVD